MAGRLPDFLIIGAQKAGTHWLRENLNQHPDVHVVASDLHYFNRHNLWRGIDWYAEQFVDRPEEAVGEGTPGYMMLNAPGTEFVFASPRETAVRMDETLPGVRLLAILRNPVDRAYSAFLHHARHGRVPAVSFFEWATSVDPGKGFGGVISGGWYHASLASFVEQFGKRLLVVLTDDVVADAAGTYRRVLEHLRVEPGFEPANVAAVVHRTPVADGPNRGPDGHRVPLTPVQRAELGKFFTEDVERLAALLGRDLSGWLR